MQRADAAGVCFVRGNDPGTVKLKPVFLKAKPARETLSSGLCYTGPGHGKITVDDRERALEKIEKLKFIGQDKIKATTLVVDLAPQ